MRYLDDVLVLLGCLALLYGTWLLSQVAVWFVGGVMLIMIGVVLAVSNTNKAKGI